MFENSFTAELATRIGRSVEVITNDNLYSGVLIRVTASIIVVLLSGGYGTGDRQTIAVQSVSHVRFTTTTAAA